MKNKILIFIFTILTFGLFLIPRTFAYSTSQLDNVNRITNIETFGNSSQPFLRFNVDNADFTGYLSIQCFDKNNINVPVNINTIFVVPPQYYNTAWQSMTSYTSNQNYAYRVASGINYSSMARAYQGIVIPSNTAMSIINNYVFNICITKTVSYLRSFVPNSYYNLDDNNNLGAFSSASVYLVKNNTMLDVSSQTLGYNNLQLGSLVNTIYENNNVSGNQYTLKVLFENGIQLRFLPNLSIKYLELTKININGTLMSYTQLLSQYDFFYNNIVLYNDNATLFISDSARSGFGNLVIYEIDFRLVDYAFKSSSYYDTQLGLKGYLQNTQITSFDMTENYLFQEGYFSGYDAGYSAGSSDGYNEGLNSQNPGGFDDLMFSIADVPMHIISSMLNFEILGFNLLGFFMGVITLVLFIHIIRKFKE